MRLMLMMLCACSIMLGAAEGKEVHITSEKQFDDIITASVGKKEVVVVDFHADWCGPCKMLAPELTALSKAKAGKVVILKVDVDAVPGLAQRFKVSSIPALFAFKDGKQVDNKVGYMDQAALTAWLGL